jgi:NAD(P)-dependent dehydrogenase (short-subunit alcohol dehydrogenase family)
MSRFDLGKRVAVVTRGNRGIGLAIADGLADQECVVSIWGRNAGNNAAAVARIQRRGGSAKALLWDVSDRQQAERATRDTLEAFGRIDGCFVNAGIGGSGRTAFVEQTDEDWRQMFSVNRDGVF